MANKSYLKSVVTKMKNKIINWIHQADLEQLAEVSKFIGIRVNPEIEKKINEKKNVTVK